MSNILSSLSLKVSAFQCAVDTVNVSITNAFPSKSRETPVNIKYSNTKWRMARSPHISPIAAPVWFSSTHNLVWFSDVGNSVRLVRGTAYDDAKSSCAPRLSTARRSAAASDLVTGPLCGEVTGVFYLFARILVLSIFADTMIMGNKGFDLYSWKSELKLTRGGFLSPGVVKHMISPGTRHYSDVKITIMASQITCPQLLV